MAGERPLEELRAEAFDAARGLLAGEQALAGALRTIREDSERAAATYRAVVQSLATALEARDGYTGAHSDIVHDLAVAVARRLGLDAAAVAEVETVALLHDIGKIGVPDHVLHKQGRLDEAEWELMRQHPVIGERILLHLPGLAGVATAVRHEHERWDGQGYPDRLAGNAIPLASRIVLACDTFNALVTDRPYRRALGVVEAKEELQRCAGTQFDPRVVDALLRCLDHEGNPSAGDGAPPIALVRPEASELEAQRLEREVQALITIVSAAAAVERLEDLAEVAADEAWTAIGASSVSISRFEADARMLRVIVNVGDLAHWEERRPANETYRIEENKVLRRLVLEGRSHVTSLGDPNGSSGEHDLLRKLGRHSSAAVPIVVAGTTWGEVWACRDAGLPVFSSRDVRFLQTIAGQIAAAVGRTELFARMADLAFRDPLTGVGNRRALEERLELLVADALAAGRDLSILLCDVDNLKELNDHQGHPAGDDALQRLAQALATESPADEQLVYRLGGDEFCLVLPELTAEAAVVLGERVLWRLSTEPTGLTASCGVASLGMGVLRVADLLRAADAAQYAAKRGGRSRVCLADPRGPIDWRRPLPLAHGSRRRLGELDTTVEIPALLGDVLAALDGPLARAPALARLEDVVTRLLPRVDGARVAISVTSRDGRTIDSVFMLDARRGRVWRRELAESADVWPVDEYPGTAAILEHGGAFVVRAGDPEADPAERAVLTEFGMQAVLAVAARDDQGTWLVELYADGATAPLEPLEPVVRLLVAEAVRGGRSFPTGARAVA